MTDKTELTPEEQAEFDKLEAAEAEKAKEAEQPTKGAKGGKAKKADADGASRERVLAKKAFINGRLYEAGETVNEDENGNFLAVPKSKPAGDLTVDDLKQLLAKAEAAGRSAA